MDIAEFLATLEAPAPPDLGLALQALWWDHRGDWQRAHECAQAMTDADGAEVHAYLHRKEGDLPNARYWYRQASRPMPDTSLEQEWTEQVSRRL